jgi:hypothetical protein
MSNLTRKVALQVLRAAGAQNDKALFVRTYVENRISLAAANTAWREGQRLAAFVAARDARAEG